MQLLAGGEAYSKVGGEAPLCFVVAGAGEPMGTQRNSRCPVVVPRKPRDRPAWNRWQVTASEALSGTLAAPVWGCAGCSSGLVGSSGETLWPSVITGSCLLIGI